MKDLNYYKENATENYMTTPISVLRYITELEKNNEAKQLILFGVSKRFNTRSFIVGIGCGMAIGLTIALIILNVF